MKHRVLIRILTLVLSFCVILPTVLAEAVPSPLAAEFPAAEEVYEEEYEEDFLPDEEMDEMPEEEPPPPKVVSHSELTLQLELHPEGFPEPTNRLRDWKTFLDKVSLRGYLNAMDFLHPLSRVYFNGGLFLEEKNRLPFVYDGYFSYRYIISPMTKNQSVHFQMHNFFEFMLKPYYFMELPTQFLAFLIYPEATYEIAEGYYAPVARALAGEGSRHISYEDLYGMAEELNAFFLEDTYYELAYLYFKALLIDVGADEILIAKLETFPEWLDYLDPEQEGMYISVDGDTETYELGGNTVFEKTASELGIAWTLTLPDPEEYLAEVQFHWTPSGQGAKAALQFSLALEEEPLIQIDLSGDGLPCEGVEKAEGTAHLTAVGIPFEQEVSQTFAHRWSVDQPEQPFHVKLDLDLLHPQTGAPALSLHYAADMKRVKESVFVDGGHPHNDFFSLNDSLLEEFKDQYKETIALAMIPFVLEMPKGVLNDLYDFGKKTDILVFLGL